jgi:hypothetical protein
MSLLDSGIRSACTTLTDCEVAVLSAEAMDDMMTKDPQLAASLVALLARKLSLRLRVVSARLSENQPDTRHGENAMERDQASKFINDLLKLMVSRNGSDLFITAEFPPAIKVDGKVTKVSPQPLTPAHADAGALHHERQAGRRLRAHQGVQLRHLARRHRALPRQRLHPAGPVGMVLRTIPLTLPTIDGLGLPQVLKEVAMTKRGLCILVGATGSGKSTTLAAMVDWRNENSFGHIITVEDPVEFVHPHKNCVTQREVGLDTDSWEAALKNTLRQAPDVILMGEIRDRETMEHVPSPKPATCAWPRCTPTAPTRRWTASSTSSPKSAARSC